jgi:hypothetical protein
MIGETRSGDSSWMVMCFSDLVCFNKKDSVRFVAVCRSSQRLDVLGKKKRMNFTRSLYPSMILTKGNENIGKSVLV